MQVLKFGGTSVGAPARIRGIAELIDDGQAKIVVLSAVAGTTNKLVDLAACLYQDNEPGAAERLGKLREEYAEFIRELLPDRELRERGNQAAAQSWKAIAQQFAPGFGPAGEKVILAQGELISTQLFQLYLESLGRQSVLLPALDFMRIDANGEPDVDWIRERLSLMLAEYPSVPYFITQGYICRNAAGEVDNLQRGGSDYTATLIGAALKVDEIQIWTDIDGIHNNDPRIVEGTQPIRKVSFREAAELAYFGAKILHPTCVIPAEEHKVPVRLKNTFAPDAEGTLISDQSSGRAVTAIAAKDGITAIRIRSGRMLNAYGFLRRVFEVFETYETPIDMITTSEVSVSLTIDQPRRLNDIVRDLSAFGEVSVDHEQTIICIVGDDLHAHPVVTRDVFAALAEAPVRMVSYGGSNNNISLLVPANYKAAALRTLNRHLFKADALV